MPSRCSEQDGWLGGVEMLVQQEKWPRVCQNEDCAEGDPAGVGKGDDCPDERAIARLEVAEATEH